MSDVSYRVVNQGEMYPYVIFDNWYTEEEEKKIWSELDFYTTSFPDKIDIGDGDVAEALDDKGNIIKIAKGMRWYPRIYYNQDNLSKFPISLITSTTIKTRNIDFKNILIHGCEPYGNNWRAFNFLPSTDAAGIIVTYYGENDEYLPHYDMSGWTQLVWMVKDEEAMELGSGDLEFPDISHTIPLKNNRSIFFPSCYLHASKPIKFKKQSPVIGDGKYTITTFYERDRGKLNDEYENAR
jgi:hypothetical protein